ncbi:MAG: type I-C CRISPR-associated protein Cas8c/Csd1 [Gammaproteobacteria bacterium]|nr:type I-C CRISPR-associated protein Cas8c/Csd1 [Gammaproteobacteria bacterium]
MLNRLVDYARTHVPLSESGFTVRDIRWRIEIANDGRLAGVIPLGDEKRGAERWGCPEMHDMQSGGKAHFLIDNLKTILLLKAGASDKQRHDFYVARISDAASQAPMLRGLARLLSDTAGLEELRQTLLEPPHKAKPTDNLEWRIDGIDPLTEPAVRDWWKHWRLRDRDVDEDEMVCFVSGETTTPAKIHPKVMGLPGGQGSGDALIGFDKEAFTSFGLKKSTNAAVSEGAARSYVDALNHLKRHHSKQLGEGLLLHWFRRAVVDDENILAWLHDPPEVAEASAALAARRLFDAIRSGQRPDLASNEFYVLTVSGMAGRVMVRDWMEGDFKDLAGNIAAWFADLAVVSRSGHEQAPDPKFMAVCGALVRDLKDLPAPTAATLWKTAVQNLPIPQPLMSQALMRFRIDIVNKDQPPISHARMGLIKAYFVRLKPGGDPTMTAYLNPDHPTAAYHCGRLMAVLAELQYSALGDVGAGVVQRYYAAASQTPGLILGRLVRNAQNHLNKPDKPWLGPKYERPMMDIVSRLKDEFPRILDLEGQGLFALGYYQQLAALRAGNKNATSESITEHGEPK